MEIPNNKMALITGAEQGLGEAIAERLSNTGWAVHNIHGSVVRNGKSAITSFIRRLHQTIGRPSLVINNFGINHLSWIGETPEDDEAILMVNMMGPYWVVNEMVNCGRMTPARVINIASATHRVPQRTSALYCASKAGLVQMTKVMARELAPSGWVVNAVAPGSMEGTRMTELVRQQVSELRGWSQEKMGKYERDLIPMGRTTDVYEVTDAVMGLIDMPPYVNGHVLEVMGGV